MTPGRFLAVAMLFLPAACAGAPVAETVAPTGWTSAELVQQRVDDILAAGAGGLPRNAVISIDEVEEADGRWVVQASFHMPERFGRPAEDFAIVTPCQPGELRDCARKLIETAAAAR